MVELCAKHERHLSKNMALEKRWPFLSKNTNKRNDILNLF